MAAKSNTVYSDKSRDDESGICLVAIIEDKKVIDILSEDSNGNRNSAIHPYQTLDDFIEKNLRDYTVTHMSPDVETVNIGESLYKKLKKKKLI